MTEESRLGQSPQKSPCEILRYAQNDRGQMIRNDTKCGIYCSTEPASDIIGVFFLTDVLLSSY